MPARLALAFGLFLGPLILAGGRSPETFGQAPEMITFRWLPGATVHNCADVEERTELTCRKIDWIRDGRNKRRWLAVCQ